jgi:pimeloyl-ACP methyl ester carboxylesterase
MTTKTVILPAFRTLLGILKWIVILLILLFSVATFMGGSYLQTGLLWLAILVMAWWPRKWKELWKRSFSLTLRLLFILVLLAISIGAFRPEPKKSIYLSEELRMELMGIYDEKVRDWPTGTEDIAIEGPYGTVHFLACGNLDNPPLVMIHAASMGAHSWAENLSPLLDHYRIYSIDNIGEGNKSQLTDPLVYPRSEKEIADHLAFILDELGVARSSVFGASNGGFVSMCFADHYPDRVESLALFGPMGLTQLTPKSFMMLSIATMYPFPFVREGVRKWALGEDPYIVDTYGDWFNCIMKGTIPSVAEPVPMTSEQKSSMNFPVLLFLGTEDPIVGDASVASDLAGDFPDIQIEILESSHLVAVEHAEYVNRKVAEFLGCDPGSQDAGRTRRD